MRSAILFGRLGFACGVLLSATPLPASDLPMVTVSHDDTVITRSCRILIPPGLVLPDRNSNGVIQVTGNNLTIEFLPGSELRGAPPGTEGDRMTGTGIQIAGRRKVILVNARVHGFKAGLVIRDSRRVSVEGGDFSENYRQRLKSTPAKASDEDWLYPHHADARSWRDEYGGAVCVEDSERVTVRGIRVRRGQNGILLHRVENSDIYDNDCSFLSGWGVALWRSSGNRISRNALDFCVRGHSEGVYNRGCDSAGILCFEQSSRNLFLENSATHSGDGFFGFAGQEAIGEHWMNAERERLRKETGRKEVEELIHVPSSLARRLSPLGCNDNVLLGNDFSHAPAHGIEMTFSEGNSYLSNRVVGNAICGFWGGYSSRSVVVGNRFEANGGMAYGLERGGINMEHAADNLILGNLFLNNRCALHFWWNNSPLLRFPGIAGGPSDVSGNWILDNHIEVNAAHPFVQPPPKIPLWSLQLRGGKSGHVHDNVFARNQLILSDPHGGGIELEPGCPAPAGELTPAQQAKIRKALKTLPAVKPLGARHPVGAHPEWDGREKIVVGEWGPNEVPSALP